MSTPSHLCMSPAVMLPRETIASQTIMSDSSLLRPIERTKKERQVLNSLQPSSTIQIPYPLLRPQEVFPPPESLVPLDPSSQPPTKRRKRSPSRRTNHRRPPEFYDNLSRLQLTRLALQEFDRRTILPVVPKPPELAEVKGDLIKELMKFTRRDSPELRDLRGYSELEAGNSRSTTKSISRRHEKKSGASFASELSGKSMKKCSAYDADFEQKYIDFGIYHEGYDDIKPSNWDEINNRLAQPRPSLSLSSFPHEAFLEFKRKNREAKSEPDVMSKVFPIINGTTHIPFVMDRPFKNFLTMTDGTTTNPRPDYYEGSSPSELRPHIRRSTKLGHYIVPSKHSSEPLLPNNFVEVKGSSGDAAVLERQAMQDAAHGARGMLAIQSYGRYELLYDGNAYTIASTYNRGSSTLQMFTMHPTEPLEPTGRPEYHMNQLRSISLTDNRDSFRDGITWLRNAKDWAKEQRDAAIVNANATENATYEDAPTTTQGDQYLMSYTSGRPAQIESSYTNESMHEESETSTDELARGFSPPAKRSPRPRRSCSRHRKPNKVTSGAGRSSAATGTQQSEKWSWVDSTFQCFQGQTVVRTQTDTPDGVG